MPCSACNADLDAYVDGTLSPLRAARVEAHVAACPECAALLAEVRVIDALLIAPRAVDPAPNFTFKVMAEVRCLPPPRAHHHFSLAVVGAYIVFAWIAIGGFFALGGHTARAALATVGGGFVRAFSGAGTLAAAGSHVFGGNTLGVTAVMGALLAADLVAAALVFGAFFVVRSRHRTATARTFESC